jgi:hypothetical protein
MRSRTYGIEWQNELLRCAKDLNASVRQDESTIQYEEAEGRHWIHPEPGKAYSCHRGAENLVWRL